ncbi:hypothetical protein PpBr36_04377 [Pyricularia pennisetigena]|uniref:hypothetical protein n=1 Tax=Pyricularia pennisetigena TaxID=1578925 RepID=UPI001153A0BB|nr:hypothetical protein PpBr36_04377 [Pyricularia pennisetigena]TLS27498.1 hypothetical protein PpBr36_04377 [Pyricularia pennisetigena]
MSTTPTDTAPLPRKSLIEKVEAWGTSSLPPMGMATLITALHFRPFQPLPMLLTPALIFTSYVTLSGWAIDGAGLNMACSGLYALLAMRRRPASIRNKFSARGFVRGVAIGLGASNAIAGGWVYFTGDRKREKADRIARNRWGGPTPK